MIERIPPLRTTSVLLALALLVSCAPSPSTPAYPDTANTSRPETAVPETPQGTLAPTPTIFPTNTVFPGPTPTPWPTQPITSDNVLSLQEINRWGRGSVIRIQKLDHKQNEYLVLTPLGLYWYTNSAPFLQGFMPDVNDFVLSPDQQWLAVSKSSGEVEIGRLDDSSLTQSITHRFPADVIRKIQEHLLLPCYVGGMAFSPDGSQIAIGYADGKIELWRIGESEPYTTLQHDALALWDTNLALLFELSFSPDGKTLTAFKFEPLINANRLTFWSLPSGKLISVSDVGRFYDFPESAYLPDGKTLLVFSRSDSYLKLNLWDIETGKKLSEFGTGLAEIDSTELTASGDQLTMIGSDAQQVTYRQVRRLPDGKLVENQKLEQLPEDRELADLKELLLEQGHYENSWGSENRPGQARLVMEAATPIRVLEENYLLTIPDALIESPQLPAGAANGYYDPQGNFAAWCEAGKLNIFDQDGTAAATDLPFKSDCEGVVVSPQKHYAAVWNSQALYLQDLVTGKYSKPVFDRRWQSSPMLTARFSDDEQVLITSKTALITVWQVDPFQKIADSHNENRYVGNNLEIAVSKDKSTAVTFSISRGSTSDRTSQLLVWRVQDAFPLHRINPPLVESARPMFTSYALSPDGSLIASGDDFGGIRFWSVQSGEELAAYSASARPLDMAFTPDGTGLVIILVDGTIRLLGVPPETY
jgi:WD40 repeat protein